MHGQGCRCYLTGKSIWQNTMVRDSPRLGETHLGTHPTCWYENLISFSYSPLRNMPRLIFHRCFCKAGLIGNGEVYRAALPSHPRADGVPWDAGREQQEPADVQLHVSHCTLLFLLEWSTEHSVSAFTHTHRTYSWKELQKSLSPSENHVLRQDQHYMSRYIWLTWAELILPWAEMIRVYMADLEKKETNCSAEPPFPNVCCRHILPQYRDY